MSRPLDPDDVPVYSKRAHEAAVAQAVAAERSRLFTAIRHKIPLSEPWRGPALDLIYEVWRETDG